MSILEITFGISFICNDLDLTDILSKTEKALSTAIYLSEVRQLEKNIKFTVRQIASTCLSVKTPQTTLNEIQNQPFQLQTTSCPQTPHQTPQHQIWASTRHFGTYRIFAKVYADVNLRAAKALARLHGCTG